MNPPPGYKLVYTSGPARPDDLFWYQPEDCEGVWIPVCKDPISRTIIARKEHSIIPPTTDIINDL